MAEGSNGLQEKVDKLERTVEALKESFQEDREENIKAHGKIHDKIAEVNTVVAVSAATTDGNYKALLGTVEKIEKTVDDLAARPTKRWDGLVGAVIAGLISITISLIFSGIV